MTDQMDDDHPDETGTRTTDPDGEPTTTLGPIDYLALEFPGGRLEGQGLAALLDLVDRGVIRLLDLRVAKIADDGSAVAMELADLDADGTIDLAVFSGVESGLLDEEDVAQSAALTAPGNAVGVLVYENTWARPFVAAMREVGAEVVASGRIPADEVAAALDDLDAREGA